MSDSRPERATAGLEGHYAGIVTRTVAFTIDLVAIAVAFSLAGSVLEYLLTVLRRHPVHLSDASVVSTVLFVLWVLVYFCYPLAASGRTLGMAMLGVRVVRADGRDLDARHAVIRVVALPLSFLLLGIGVLLILVRSDRRALHDLIGNSAVVYAWDARAARLRFLARQ